MPKVDLASLPHLTTTGYPPPFDRAVAGRSRQQVALALSDFAANLITLAPGAWASQRHWHSAEDELVMIVSGEAVLVEDGGETLLRAGDIATWAKGVPNAHHLQNRSDAPVVFLAVGPDRPGEDVCLYPDIGMRWSAADGYVVGPPRTPPMNPE
ncbi:cupin domain-containing protein [Sandaracinobacteroides saxicola]|uniref:Cupin domain-containing protein n=1 Tax=Sandaracinobacteroides saxicola TaxID=2759707 RepID=A0A7G5IG50_9SPHN|nr:cupin domain-containing protein [Sandaracinobacteroides saxicola]QMW22342.1 cupin domain-containing protein [Sandaracinobacteroides saxicola]